MNTDAVESTTSIFGDLSYSGSMQDTPDRSSSGRSTAPVMAAMLLGLLTSAPVVQSRSEIITDTGVVLVKAINEQNILDVERSDLVLIDNIRKFLVYEENWDGRGALAPNPKAIDEAEMFMRRYNIEKMELPFVSLANDGEIVFLWKNDKLHLDLGFYGDGTYSFFAELRDGGEIICDGEIVDKELPQEIVDLIIAT